MVSPSLEAMIHHISIGRSRAWLQRHFVCCGPTRDSITLGTPVDYCLPGMSSCNVRRIQHHRATPLRHGGGAVTTTLIHGRRASMSSTTPGFSACLPAGFDTAVGVSLNAKAQAEFVGVKMTPFIQVYFTAPYNSVFAGGRRKRQYGFLSFAVIWPQILLLKCI